MAISGNNKVAQASLNNDISRPLSGFLSKPSSQRQASNRKPLGNEGLIKRQTQANALGNGDRLTARQQARQAFLSRKYGIQSSLDTAPSTNTGNSSGTQADNGVTNPAATGTPILDDPVTTPTAPAAPAVSTLFGGVDPRDLGRNQRPSSPVNTNAAPWSPAQRDFILPTAAPTQPPVQLEHLSPQGPQPTVPVPQQPGLGPKPQPQLPTGVSPMNPLTAQQVAALQQPGLDLSRYM
jgi:hypothetical protein